MTSARLEAPVGSKTTPKARVAAACGTASESIGIVTPSDSRNATWLSVWSIATP